MHGYSQRRTYNVNEDTIDDDSAHHLNNSSHDVKLRRTRK